MQDRGDQVAEDQIEEGGHQRFDDGVSPRHQESDRGMDAPRCVGVETAGGREVLGELPDRDGHQEAADQGQEDG